MPKRFFVTGTDTGVGKTVVSALLCAALDAIYWKPIQTGTREGTDRNTVMRLAQLSARPHDAGNLPLRAARFTALGCEARGGAESNLRKIKLPRIRAQDGLIVEGAGGVLVPINKTQLMIDLMTHLKLPVLLVSRTLAWHDQPHPAFARGAAIGEARYSRRDYGGQEESRKSQSDRALRRHVRWWALFRVLANLNRNALLKVFRKNISTAEFSAT